MSLNKSTTNILGTVVRSTLTVVLILLLIVLGTTAYRFGRAVFSGEGFEKEPGTEIVVMVEPGESLREVAQMLYESKVIGDPNVFYVQSLLYEADFQEGTYTLNSSSSGEEIIAVLSAKQEAVEE